MHPYLFGAAVVGRTSCHGFARVGGVRTAQTLNRGPHQSPAKRVWWGEEEQGSDMTDAHAWASGIERTLRRRRGLCPRGKKDARSCLRSRRTHVPNPQEGAPRNWGSRGATPMNTRLRRGVHRRSPLGASLVPFCASRKEHPSLKKGTRPAGRNPASRIEIYDLKENNHG